MSSFPDHIQLRNVVEHAILYGDSLGCNEQELPNIRAVLNSTEGGGGRGGGFAVVSDSHPRIAHTLDHMRAVFELTRGRAERREGGRSLSRLHVHTLAYQVLIYQISISNL